MAAGGRRSGALVLAWALVGDALAASGLAQAPSHKGPRAPTKPADLDGFPSGTRLKGGRASLEEVREGTR